MLTFLNHTMEGAGRKMFADRWCAGRNHGADYFFDLGFIAEFFRIIRFFDDGVLCWRSIGKCV